jgi:D-alanine-D-alanine ligase
MKIGVMYGGISAEREVSLSSGKAVLSACKFLGHEVVSLDPQDGMSTLIPSIKSVDVVFNGLHGGDGENGVIARLSMQIAEASFPEPVYRTPKDPKNRAITPFSPSPP